MSGYGSNKPPVIITIGFRDMVNILDYNVPTDGTTDATAKIQAVIDMCKATGKTMRIPAGDYVIKGTLKFGTSVSDAFTAKVIADFGARFIHQPTTDVNCVEIWGANGGRTHISGLQIICNNTIGNDGVRVSKGDYVTLEDIYVEAPKRHGVTIAPSGTGVWIENLVLNRVKIQNSKQDGFAFIVSNATGNFINQVDMIECETRSSTRHALSMTNLNTLSNAYKMSNFRFMNCEFHASAGAYDIINLKGAATNGCIENLSFHNCAVEETNRGRKARAVSISGKVQGKFEFKNNIMYGVEVLAPIASASGTGGTLEPNTYYVSHAYVMDTGDIGARSVETAGVAVTAGQQVTVTIPTLPNGAVSANIYFRRAGELEHLQGNTVTTSFVQSTAFNATGVQQSQETDIIGGTSFPVFEIEDISNPNVPLLKSNLGVSHKLETGTLAPNAVSDIYTPGTGLILEGWVIQSFNVTGIFAKFTIINGSLIVHDDGSGKIGVTMNAGKIRITNKDTVDRAFTLYTQRITTH